MTFQVQKSTSLPLKGDMLKLLIVVGCENKVIQTHMNRKDKMNFIVGPQ